MVEFKTLKDFVDTQSKGHNGDVFSSDLRQSAIEDIKELQERDYDAVSDIDINEWYDGGIMSKGIIHFLMHRYNITEEDLREGERKP